MPRGGPAGGPSLLLPLLPKLPKCLLRSPAFKTRLDVHRTSDSLGCRHLGGHRAGFNLGPCTLWNGLGFAQRVVMSLSSLKCFAPEAEACSDIVEVSSMISDIMMKCVCNSFNHSRPWRRSWNGNRGARMEVLYGSQQERSHTSAPASSAVSCKRERFSLFKMYSDRLSEAARVCLKENAPQVRKNILCHT